MRLPWRSAARGDAATRHGDGDVHGNDDGDSSGSRSSSNADAMTTVNSILDTEHVRRVTTGEETTYDGDAHSMPASIIDRQRTIRASLRKGDPRIMLMDVNDVQPLLDRYHKEFAKADAAMRQRTTSTPPVYKRIAWSRASADRHFDQWRNDQAAVRERMHVHWLDVAIDQPSTSIVYFARCGTTVGLCYGIGRTAYLYRTMDKVYAKLNGVSLLNIALYEVSIHVLKGALVAVAACSGFHAGATLTNVVATLCSDDVKAPPRTWYHIAASGVGAGLGAGASLAILQHKTLTWWGMRFVLASTTITGAAVGLYLGRVVYLPTAQARTHNLYEPYWRPWYTRYMHEGGNNVTRGRYV